MDIRDVVRIYHYKTPPSLSTFKQRYGRVGRDGRPALVILFVEPSIFQMQKKRKPNSRLRKFERLEPDTVRAAIAQAAAQDDAQESDHDDDNIQPVLQEDGEMTYRKTVEGGMRDWIQTVECRRNIEREYFANPPNESGRLFRSF